VRATKRAIVVLSVLLLSLSFPAEAQQEKISRIGLLAPPGWVEERIQIRGLRDGLREAGYLEGKNLLLEMRKVETYDQLRLISRDYIEKKVNIIVTSGGTATQIAKEATSQIPIVFIWGVADPVRSGLVKSLAHPRILPV
jgi:putative tryptophan/tyrosine transport system substrate-binding protein